MNKIFLVCIVLLAAFSRLAPHPPNFTPILAITLFSGICFREKYSFLIPLCIMFVSDFIIGNFDMAMWVYPSLLLVYFIGNYFIKNISYKNVLISSFISSIIFFLVTNFGSWIGNVFYPQNFNGLIASYIAGIPFYKNTLISTLLFSSGLYLVYAYLLRKFNHLYQNQ